MIEPSLILVKEAIAGGLWVWGHKGQVLVLCRA